MTVVYPLFCISLLASGAMHSKLLACGAEVRRDGLLRRQKAGFSEFFIHNVIADTEDRVEMIVQETSVHRVSYIEAQWEISYLQNRSVADDLVDVFRPLCFLLPCS